MAKIINFGEKRREREGASDEEKTARLLSGLPKIESKIDPQEIARRAMKEDVRVFQKKAEKLQTRQRLEGITPEEFRREIKMMLGELVIMTWDIEQACAKIPKNESWEAKMIEYETMHQEVEEINMKIREMLTEQL